MKDAVSFSQKRFGSSKKSSKGLKAAAENDTVVVFAYAKVSDPGMDRQSTSLKLDAAQQEMILKVAEAAHAAGNKVVVVLNNDSAVVMEDWIDSVDAILDMYYPGQRGGVATANLLTGAVNPGGKLAGFEKVRDLEPGESRQVTIHVNERSMSKPTNLKSSIFL